ncbi:MAG: extracellular solute-binding protein [Devosia sp.]
MNRRALLAGIAAGAAGVAASSVLGTRAFAASEDMRFFWWGNPSRDERTYKTIDIFNKSHPDVVVSGESIAWADYWTKMATQTAGRNMADVVQMDYGFIFEYVRRGALQPLDDLIGSTIKLDSYDKAALTGGMVDGKLYGLNIGSNSQACLYNTRLVKESGAEFDPIGWTYDDVKRVSKAIFDKTGVFGTDDQSLNYVSWQDWAQQQGHDFYDADGKIQATEDDVIGYWSTWKELRDMGVIPPGDVTVSKVGASLNEEGLPTGTTAMSYHWSNQVVGMQTLMEDTVGVGMYPKIKAGQPNQFIKPGMFLSITRDCKNPKLAGAFINDWINDKETGLIIGLERGIPPNADMRAALTPTFTDAEKASVSYFNAIQPYLGALPPAPPKGAGEVNDAFVRIGSDVVLGTMSIADGAKKYFDEAQDIIERAA